MNLIAEFNLETKVKFSSHTIYRNNQLIHSPTTSSLKSLLSRKNLKENWYLFNGFLHEESTEEKTVHDLIKEKKLSPETVWYFLVPLASLYMSMSYLKTSQLPLSIIIYWWKKYCCPFYVNYMYSYIKGGNQKLIESLISHNKKTQFFTKQKVEQVKRSEKSVSIHVNGSTLEFDKVIMATDPRSTLTRLSSPLSHEQEILGNIDIGHVKSIVHQNSSYLHGKDITVKIQESPKIETKMMATWGANAYFDLRLNEEYYTTIMSPDLNPFSEKEILQENLFTVPLPTKKTFAAIKNIDSLNENNLNSYFCGSYFNPFFYHEDAISSVKKMTDKIKKDEKI